MNTLGNGIYGYHYTNFDSLRAMKTGSDYGRTGLIQLMRLASLRVHGLPDKMYEPVIYALPEAEPVSWTQNAEFPMLWKRHTDDFFRTDKIVLLRFRILPEDDAYVLERAHIEREQYRKGYSIDSVTEACLKFFDSRVSALDYTGEFNVPQVTVWSEIPFERLELIWIKPREEVKSRILEICK